MKREWKPGDVAMVTLGGREYIAECRRDFGRLAWFGAWHGFCVDVDKPTGARPLIVIDPEDREQVERLFDLFDERFKQRGTDSTARDDLQAALRQFANPTPPKPDEPQGLGAVVEDAEGRRHVRVYDGLAAASSWLGHISDDGGDQKRRWSEIAAVRVLSEGVQS